eukprot:g33620.t1
MNAIDQFVDDTTMVGQISNNEESKYRSEIEGLVIDVMVKKAQQRLFFLRKFGVSIGTLTNFYRCSILSGCMMAWYGNCSAQDCTKLQIVVYTAQNIMEAKLPSVGSIYTAHCRGKAANFKE